MTGMTSTLAAPLAAMPSDLPAVSVGGRKGRAGSLYSTGHLFRAAPWSSSGGPELAAADPLFQEPRGLPAPPLHSGTLSTLSHPASASHAGHTLRGVWRRARPMFELHDPCRPCRPVSAVLIEHR